MAKKPDHPTRLKIIQTGLHLYLEKGFTATTNKMICNRLNISTGQFTNFFPTKEHLLAELVRDLCGFQQQRLEQQVEEGRTSLLALCLELATMASLCRSNPIARDFYLAAYAYPMTLEVIRTNDAERASYVFGPFCPGWEKEHFRRAVNVVSGIEYAAMVSAYREEMPLDDIIGDSLRVILQMFQVPEGLQKVKLEKLFSLDYRGQGKEVFSEFMAYIDEVTEQAVAAGKE